MIVRYDGALRDRQPFRLGLLSGSALGAWLGAPRGMMSGAEGRICVLCGLAFALFMPPGEEEPERDKLCPECLVLPPPPTEPVA